MAENNKRLFLVILLCGSFVLTGCDMFQNMFSTAPAVPKITPKGQTPSVANQVEESVQGTVLARINKEVITLESFDEKVKAFAALAPESKIKINTPDAKKTYLNDLVTQELLVQEARSRGIDKQKEIKDAIEEFKKQVLIRQLVKDETRGITVEPSEIEAFYNRYKKEFASPQEIKVSEIVVASEAAAKEILIGLLQGGDFAAVAKERSAAPSASNGGSVGLVKKGDKFDKYNEVISMLEAGQVSQIFKGPDGFYIVKVDERKGGTVPSMNEVYDQIKDGLLQQKATARIQELSNKIRSEAKVEIKEDLLR
jgi:parvulin-like peptidyl-prolyl isomerase